MPEPVLVQIDDRSEVLELLKVEKQILKKVREAEKAKKEKLATLQEVAEETLAGYKRELEV